MAVNKIDIYAIIRTRIKQKTIFVGFVIHTDNNIM